MITEKTFNAEEVAINYAEGPDSGPPLVLLHGTANRWQAFQPIIPASSTRWHIYAPDFRGHGRSQHADRYGFGYYLDDTIKFLEEVVKEPSVVFGHSLGGRVATKIAAEHPDRVKAIILGDSSLNEPAPSTRMGRAFDELIKLIDENETYQKIYEALRATDPLGFDPTYGLERAKSLSLLDTKLLQTIVDNGMNLDSPGNHSYGYHPDEHLKKIKCPVLVLQAEHGMLSDGEVEKALRILPEVYHIKLKDVPHEFLSKPAEPLLKALTAFLEAIIY
jgi:pimeloyl-ACP methyl ester carboxylesterase